MVIVNNGHYIPLNMRSNNGNYQIKPWTLKNIEQLQNMNNQHCQAWPKLQPGCLAPLLKLSDTEFA